jgi:plastocyanin domain-containing protein
VTRAGRLALAGAALAAVAAVAWVAAGARRSDPWGLQHAVEATARPGPDGVLAVETTAARGAYRPNVIHARAGLPLRLHVARHGADRCAEHLLVPDLRLDLSLPVDGRATLEVPAAPAGAYLFTCGDAMVKGVLLLE